MMVLKATLFTSSNFQSFYDRLLTLRSEFTEKYNFLAFKNEDNEPKMKNEPLGTIRIFLDLIPENYGKTLFANLRSQKYHDLKSFLDAFYEEAKKHYKISVEAKRLYSFMPPAPFPNSAATEAGANTASRKPFMRRPTLSFLGESQEQVDDLDELELNFQPMYLEDYVQTDDLYGESEAEDQDLDRKPSATEADSPESSQLNAFGGGNFKTPHRVPPKPGISAPTSILRRPPDAAPKGPNGCFRAMSEGKCTKPGCTFDHSIPVLDATREDFINRVSKRPYAARAVNEMSGTAVPGLPPEERP